VTLRDNNKFDTTKQTKEIWGIVRNNACYIFFLGTIITVTNFVRNIGFKSEIVIYFDWVEISSYVRSISLTWAQSTYTYCSPHISSLCLVSSQSNSMERPVCASNLNNRMREKFDRSHFNETNNTNLCYNHFFFCKRPLAFLHPRLCLNIPIVSVPHLFYNIIKWSQNNKLHITVGRQNQRFTKWCISLKAMQERWYGIC